MFAQIRRVLQSPEVAARAITAATEDNASEPEAMAALSRIDTIWEELFPAEQARILNLLVEQVDVTTSGFDLRLRTGGLRHLVAEFNQPAAAE
ncbi:MAG: hypothetical protein ABT940_07275 [Alphaproteobacteria bacterium]